MKTKKIQSGVYRITDNEGTWIAKGGIATMNGKWTAYECAEIKDCSDMNNWGVQFNKLSELKAWSEKFTKVG